jgi:hypothetical protein
LLAICTVGPSVGGVEYPLDIAPARSTWSTRKPAECLVIWPC